MNGRSDASTSTDDVKGRPLCLFYFSQPLGVLAAEPPRAAPCPAHLLHAHMAPAWAAPWPPAPPAAQPRAAPAPPARRDTLSSSLFSSDAWPPSSGSSRRDRPRRGVPYHALLPPLQLPAPALAPPSSDDSSGAWPLRSLQPERFSLPPIELPRLCELEPDSKNVPLAAARQALPGRLSPRHTPCLTTPRRVTPRRAPPGVHKPRRRARTSALRRTLTNLIQRTVKDSLLSEQRAESASSTRVRAALRTLRAAWPPPAPAPAPPPHYWRPGYGSRASSADGPAAAAMPRAGASPGLLRRRYSMPETIMRKYRLAQQSSEPEEPCAATSPSAASPPSACVGCGGCGSCGGCGAHARADREVMRKSALLRRLWGRAPAPAAPRASRSLHGSSSELRRSPAGSGWATPKRQRLEWSERGASHGEPPSDTGASPVCSDCTFTSHCARSPASPASRGDPSAHARPERDVFTRYSELANDTARLHVAPASPPSPHPATATSDSLSDSLPTAQEARLAAATESLVVDVEANKYTSLPFQILSTGETPPYEVLEIVVSETVDTPRAPRAGSPLRCATSPRARNINIDEYVSNILVESLNSLSEQLESMSAAVGGAGVVVEKEIKVRLQNTGVNTIVHLSPTSNHQIIFGNEELCHADNNNPPPRSAAPDDNNNGDDEPPDVNRAVLQQIQKLFHDELYRLDPAVDYPGEPTLTRIEVSNVDLFLDTNCESGPPSAATAVGVGTGNYWARAEPALVPRLSALPYSASMEVNTSSSEAEPSACTSLVDSLDDPASPRAPLRPAPVPAAARRLARSAVDVLDLLPEAPASSEPPRDRAEAFFVRIADDDRDCDKENVVVADHLPDKIRERLFRRHRKREMRMECARRGRTRGAARERRGAERDAHAVVSELIDELIAKIVQDEYKCMRIQRRSRAEPAPAAPAVRRGEHRGPRPGARPLDDNKGHAALRGLRGKLSLQPAGEPRRIYQKSEIHDGDKCIEILEILEYVDPSQISPETTNSDERHSSSKSRKSRIPIPIFERIQKTSNLTSRRDEEDRRSPPPAPSPSPPPSRRASVPPPAESRARAGSLQFRRVFDIIPEERADSPCAPEAAASARRVSAPQLPAPARTTRSAATSPPAPQRATRSTMTSPRRAAPPAPRAAGSNGNLNERRVTSENSKQLKASVTARVPPAGPGAAPTAAPLDTRRSSSSGSDSGDSSLLCATPRWLAARRRRQRPPRASRSTRTTHRPQVSALTGADGGDAAGGWSVTVAGSCRAALPADVEMRLRFPREALGRARARAPPAAPRADADATPRRSVATRSDETGTTECWCRCCGAAAPAPPALPPPRSRRASLALVRKEDSSPVARKSKKKASRTHLPELEAARGAALGERRRLSAKMRRACSLHCWLPAAPRRRGGELAVEGSAIVPELKPRAPTMSERDLTRARAPLATPRLYLRT